MVSAAAEAVGKDSVKVSAPGALREFPRGSGGRMTEVGADLKIYAAGFME